MMSYYDAQLCGYKTHKIDYLQISVLTNITIKFNLINNNALSYMIILIISVPLLIIMILILTILHSSQRTQIHNSFHCKGRDGYISSRKMEKKCVKMHSV